MIPMDTAACHNMSMVTMAEQAQNLPVVFCNFLFNGKHISFRAVGYLDICRHGWRTCPDGNVLALFHNIHKLVIVAFNGRLKRSYLIV